jgi:hypothetical protein
MTRLFTLSAALPLMLVACNDCDLQPCGTFSKTASASIDQGIAGTVSLETDGTYSGCHLCAFSAAALEVWPSRVAVREPGTACPLASSAEAHNVEARQRYEEELEAGDYLVCVTTLTTRPWSCIGISVAPRRITTLNVKHVEGPSLLGVYDPGSSTFRSDAFECPAPAH